MNYYSTIHVFFFKKKEKNYTCDNFLESTWQMILENLEFNESLIVVTWESQLGRHKNTAIWDTNITCTLHTCNM